MEAKNLQPTPLVEAATKTIHEMEAKNLQPTLVTFLLDKSNSMEQIWEPTISGFNEYLNMLKTGGEAIKFTLLQFDHFHNTCMIDKSCVAEPISNVAPLTKITYKPRGSTPLIEAATKTIHAVEASLSKFDVKHNVIVCIQTDGAENMSGDGYSWDALKELIGQKTSEGWVFNFMGTGIDAYDQGHRMGIATSNTLSTGTSRPEVMASMRAAGASSMRFAASGDRVDSAYTMAERSASGEKQSQRPSSLNPNGNLNLAPGGVSPKHDNPQAPAPKRGLDLTP